VLADNNIQDEGCLAIARIVHDLPSLSQLDLSCKPLQHPLRFGRFRAPLIDGSIFTGNDATEVIKIEVALLVRLHPSLSDVR
jgi:hypothetical protein